MTTTSLVEQMTEDSAPGPAGSIDRPVLVSPRTPSRAPDATSSPNAAGGTAMTSLRWAFAFYGGLSFLPLGTIAATWFAP